MNHIQQMAINRSTQRMNVKHIYYNNCKIYALYYKNSNTLYYNAAFGGGAKVYVLV